MQYRALPVEVTAYAIESCQDADTSGAVFLRCSDGNLRAASTDMTARYFPLVGDYWVILGDGHVYLSPKHVFESKYAPIDRVGPRIEQVVADDPGDATEGADWGSQNTARAGSQNDETRSDPRSSRVKTRAVDARYAFACEINKVERRAARMRILMDALPASFWERPDAVEVVNDVIAGLSLPP